jgi:GH24 family phage-related lysozyme (muramidase)
MSITPNEISRVKRYEGNVNYLYLDINGNPTIGYGHLVAKVSDAAALPFVLKAGGAVANTVQKQTEWTTIKSKPFGTTYPATYYAPFCTLLLQQADIDNQLSKDLAATEHQLGVYFTNYGKYPQPAKEGLVDMGFTQGVQGLASGFPNFVAAVKNMDWATAANECNRPQLAASRNLEVMNLFLSAVKPAPTPTRPKPTPTHTGSGSTGAMHPSQRIPAWLSQIPVRQPGQPALRPPLPVYGAAGSMGKAGSAGSVGGFGIGCQGIVAMVAMNSNVTVAAITAITAIAKGSNK